jgi:pimeloyl-ACP methyl ester carboxylesterase
VSPPPTKNVQANGVRFAYFEEGEGPLVLLLHGFPDTAHTWDAVRPALAAAGYRAVSPFMRGYAPTEIPADGAYDSDTLGRDVIALVEALGADRAIVVGHDWGASAAYAAATLGPERVERLVTTAIPHPLALRPSLRLLWAGRHFFALRREGAARRIRETDFAYIDTLVQRWSPAWKVPPGETDAVKASLRQPGSLEAAVSYYRTVGLRPPASLSKRIRVPSVSFAGTDDILPPAYFDRAARFFTAGYEVVRMPGGHFMHREHPERFIQELVAVLRRK